MRSKLTFLLLGLFISIGAYCQDNRKSFDLSKSFIQYLKSNQAQKAMNLCNQQMQRSISAEQLQDIWKGLEESYGTFGDTGDVFIKRFKKTNIVFTRMNFEKLPFYFKITVDSTEKIVGFYFQLAERPNLWQRPHYADYNRIKTIKTELINGDYSLDAELTLPKTIGPFPVVILVHGSGPNDMDGSVGPNKPFKDLATGLATKGIAVFRYDKRTYTYGSEMAKEEINIETVVLDDAVKAINLVKGFREIDSNRIFLLGHSLGGMMAPQIATLDSSLKGIVLFAAPARSLVEMLTEQLLIAMFRAKLKNEEEKTTEISSSLNAVIQYKNFLDQDNQAALDTTFLLGIPPSFWKSLNDYNQLKVAAELEIPMYVMQGKKDAQVFMDDFDLWNQLSAKKDNMTLKLYDELNHLFMSSKNEDPAQDYEIKGSVDAQVVEDISIWINEFKANQP